MSFMTYILFYGFTNKNPNLMAGRLFTVHVTTVSQFGQSQDFRVSRHPWSMDAHF